MAVYKVIQDIEAEDKLVGFLTLRSFIYAIIAGSLAYISFRLGITPQLGALRWLIILILFFPTLLFAVLCLPLGKEQPTEVWILSRVRFFIKPRIRIWDQAGIQELVTITAPKRIERQLTKNITQSEVRSRLRALATTLDSRGWAVKNVAVNMNVNPSYLDIGNTNSDRLVEANTLTQEQPVVDVQAEDDIMDEQNNPTAQHFDQLMQKADADRKQELKEKVSAASDDAPQDNLDFEFLDKLPPSLDSGGSTTFLSHKIVGPTSDKPKENYEDLYKDSIVSDDPEQAFLDKLHKTEDYVHAHAPSSVSASKRKKKEDSIEEKVSTSAVTENAQTAKLKELSEVAKDDKVSTLAQIAKREVEQIKQIGPDEVEIDLHSH